MTRQTRFRRTFFPAHVLREALTVLAGGNGFDNLRIGKDVCTIRLGANTWTYDTLERFLAEYRQTEYFYFVASIDECELKVDWHGDDTNVQVRATDHGAINRIFTIFEREAKACKLPDPPKPITQHSAPTVFIGHGRSPLWRDLKDHLAEKHGYAVTAYEVGARAGHTIRDILEEMLNASSFACLVLTAEDEMADGTMSARMNVVHETGLFQGRLGFSRAIVILEHGTTEFSNIHGIQQIRFSKGNIKETFGEVLATLRREFGPDGPPPVSRSSA